MARRRSLLVGLVKLALSVACFAAWSLSASAQPLRGDTSAAPRCELDVQLMGVVYNDREPERSFAMLSYGRNATRMVYVGNRVGGLRIGAILPMAIWLGPLDAPCWLPLAHEGKQVATPPRKAKKKAKKKRKKRRKKKR